MRYSNKRFVFIFLATVFSVQGQNLIRNSSFDKKKSVFLRPFVLKAKYWHGINYERANDGDLFVCKSLNYTRDTGYLWRYDYLYNYSHVEDTSEHNKGYIFLGYDNWAKRGIYQYFKKALVKGWYCVSLRLKQGEDSAKLAENGRIISELKIVFGKGKLENYKNNTNNQITIPLQKKSDFGLPWITYNFKIKLNDSIEWISLSSYFSSVKNKMLGYGFTYLIDDFTLIPILNPDTVVINEVRKKINTSDFYHLGSIELNKEYNYTACNCSRRYINSARGDSCIKLLNALMNYVQKTGNKIKIKIPFKYDPDFRIGLTNAIHNYFYYYLNDTTKVTFEYAESKEQFDDEFKVYSNDRYKSKDFPGCCPQRINNRQFRDESFRYMKLKYIFYKDE